MTGGYRRNFLLSWRTSCRNYFSCRLTPTSPLMHIKKQPSLQQTKPKFTCNSQKVLTFLLHKMMQWEEKARKANASVVWESCLCKWYLCAWSEVWNLKMVLFWKCVIQEGKQDVFCHLGGQNTSWKMYIFMSHNVFLDLLLIFLFFPLWVIGQFYLTLYELI